VHTLQASNKLLFIQHGLHVVSLTLRGFGHKGKVISEQHVGHQEISSASEPASHPVEV